MKHSKYLFILSLNLFILSGVFADTTLIPQGAVWKYLDNGSNQGTAWKSKTFNDSNWASGSAQFGYGDGDETTVVSYGTNSNNKYITTYFRHTFILNNFSSLDSLSVNILRDDGAVVYINGVEVARSNMPAGTIIYTTLASSSAGGVDETTYFNFSVPKSVLDSGTNVVAVEIHQYTYSSSDISFDIELGDIGTKAFDSNLPIIKINTFGQYIPDEPKITAEMCIIYNGVGVRNSISDSCNNYYGKIGIEERGSSSVGSYGLETRDSLGNNLNVSLLGMPAENDWILYKPTWYDNTGLHNVLAYKLSNDIGSYASRTNYCEVFINNVYSGVYILMEKIKRDKNRVNIAKLTPSDTTGDALTGGYIVKIDRTISYSGVPCTDCYYWASSVHSQYPVYEDSTIRWQTDYPDFSDLVDAQKKYIKSFIDSFELTVAGPNCSDPINGYTKYIDVGSFIDHIIINEFGLCVDAYRLSGYLYKDKDSQGGKLHAGPVWDFDRGFGSGSAVSTDWRYNYYTITPGYQIPEFWKTLVKEKNFQNQWRCKWEQVKNNVLHPDTINAFIDSLVSYLKEADQRDGNINLSGAGSIKTFISNRWSWLNANIPGICITSDNRTTYSNNNEWQVRAYPNPSSNVLNVVVNTENKENNLILELINIQGQVVYKNETKIYSVFNDIIDVSGFAKGIYYLRINTLNDIKIKKVIIN